MQFQCRNSLSLVALALAFVCIVQMAPTANALCSADQLKAKADIICKSFFLMHFPCQEMFKQFLHIFESVCPSDDGSKTSTSTAMPTGAPNA